MIFSYPELKQFFKYINENFKTTSLKNWDGTNQIILRHDLDFDIKAAYKMALIEKEFDLESTFFVMTSSPTYNPLTDENRKMIKEISDMGFEIGLHFDPTIYKTEKIEEIENFAMKESQILSFIIDKKIESLSIHNPSVHNQYPIFNNFKNAYDSKIFSPGKYISDSQMQFSSNIYEFVKNVKNSPIQILLHPMYYTSKGEKIDEIFFNFVHNFIGKIDNMYRVNKTYNTIMKEHLLDFFSTKYIGEKK